MPFYTFKGKHSTLKLFSSTTSKSQLLFFSARYSAVTQYVTESTDPHKIITPSPDPRPNLSASSISDTIFKGSEKLGSYRRGDSSFYSLIEFHASSGDFRSMEMVFGQMKREKRVFIEKNFIFVFRAYGKAHLPHKAIELFDRMVDEFHCKQTVRSFNSVLNVIIQEELYNQALEFYDYVIKNKRNISPNVLTFNLVIKALCKLGLVNEAIDLFREMPIVKCPPDVYTYCTLMDGLCKHDRLDDAVVLLDEMQIEGCYPTVATFNVLITGLCKKGDLSRAAKLIDNMFLKGCVPNEVTYNTLIYGLCLKGKMDRAISLLNRMLSNKLIPNDVTYGTMINGLVKKRRSIDGLNVLMEMEERGYKANEYSYSTIISGLFREGHSEKAMNLWDRMIEKGCKPNTVVYSVLIDGLCREGKPYEGENYLLEMINAGCNPNAYTYSSLMRGFFQVGCSDKAISIWKEMVKKNVVGNEVCYSVLIHGLCKDGKLKDALMIWKHILAKGLTLDVVVYSSMIYGFCNAGLINQAFNLFNEMQCETSNCKPDVITYNILIDALRKQDNVCRAIDLLNSMINQGCDPDPFTCQIFLILLKEKFDPPQDGQQFLDELVLKLLKRQRLVGVCTVIEVMLQRFLNPKVTTWDEVIREMCKPKKIRAVIDKCWQELFF